MIRRSGAAILLVLAAGLFGWLFFSALPGWYGAPAPASLATAVPPSAPEGGRKIRAQLFYVTDDGRGLRAVEQEVPFGETPTDQAKAIIASQLAAAPAPFVSAVPPGTMLRAAFVTDQGTAFVDLSREVATAHPGGSTNELLTIYTLVNVLAVNLPAITAVQLLVDGKEVDTLAGHMELRRPLVKNLTWVQTDAEPR